MLFAAVKEEAARGLVARDDVEGVPMLHHAASSGSLPMVWVLLSAGTDETIADASGERAAYVIGVDRPSGEARDPVTEAAISRVLERGPAFRARSLAKEESITGCDRGRPGTTVRASLGISVRLFRPRRRVPMVGSSAGEKDGGGAKMSVPCVPALVAHQYRSAFLLRSHCHRWFVSGDVCTAKYRYSDAALAHFMHRLLFRT